MAHTVVNNAAMSMLYSWHYYITLNLVNTISYALLNTLWWSFPFAVSGADWPEHKKLAIQYIDT